MSADVHAINETLGTECQWMCVQSMKHWEQNRKNGTATGQSETVTVT